MLETLKKISEPISYYYIMILSPRVHTTIECILYYYIMILKTFVARSEKLVRIIIKGSQIDNNNSLFTIKLMLCTYSKTFTTQKITIEIGTLHAIRVCRIVVNALEFESLLMIFFKFNASAVSIIVNFTLLSVMMYNTCNFIPIFNSYCNSVIVMK